MRFARRQYRGYTLLELLAAVFILSLVAACAVRTWGLSSRVPANLRLTEVASKIAVREIERIKAQSYINMQNGATTTNWYDKLGAWLQSGGSAPNGAVYKAVTTITAPLDYGGNAITGLSITNTSKDLLEVKSVVTDAGATKTYETQRALMTFGGF